MNKEFCSYCDDNGYVYIQQASKLVQITCEVCSKDHHPVINRRNIDKYEFRAYHGPVCSYRKDDKCDCGLFNVIDEQDRIH